MPEAIETKATVEIDGEEREVEVALDPETVSEAGFVPQDELDERFQEKFSEELDKRVRQRTDGLVDPDEVVENDDFLRERRPDLFEGGNGDGDIPEERLQEHREAWESRHLEPVEEKLEDVQSENERLRRDRVDRDILEAFQAQDVVPDEGMRELIRDHYRGRVRYSPEHDETFVVDEDGEFVPSGAGEGELPYLTVEEDLAAKAADEESYGSWFESRSRGGGGYEGAEGADSREFSGVKYKSDLRGETDVESRKNRVAFIEQHGYEAWASLPAERPEEDAA